MKVLFQTILTPVMTAYDTASPREPKQSSGTAKALYKFLQPVVAVVGDDGTVIYKSGEFHPFNYLVLGAFLFAGYLIIRRISS